MYQYSRPHIFEPDWRRFPGWKDVTEQDWQSPQWQRRNSVKNVHELRKVMGSLLSDSFYEDLIADQTTYATMSMLVPPQMINTMVAESEPQTDTFYADPVRRYMLPVFSDRDAQWPSHPVAIRDPLLEASMWVVEGLIHRYPTKVLLELTTTCPQYCGHCTRMDLVGGSTREVTKLTFSARRDDRYSAAVSYLRSHPEVRDIVLSGGDVANVAWPVLESLVGRILEIESIRDIRLASKSLVALPQHWSQPAVLAGLERLAKLARSRGVQIALHTHANAAQQVTESVAAASRSVLDAGLRDVRNQGVILRGTNDSASQLLDLCFTLYDGAGILPYYFYMCDLIPNCEHWRVSLSEAQALQDDVMGYLPGFATPRVVCDVPGIGKRWVHQNVGYDRERGISHWTKQFPQGVYYDPLRVLPDTGLRYWNEWSDHPSRSRETADNRSSQQADV